MLSWMRPRHRLCDTAVMRADSDKITTGWRLVHIGLEGDDVSVAGINPWHAGGWTSTGVRITVAHPSYPAQRHTMRVYILDSQHEIEFAAGEFSNGVWGIYAPETGRA